MRVRMVAHITGLRNGVAWPAPGEEMDLPRSEAETMAEAGHVEIVVETRPAPQDKVEKRTRRKTGES